jgi:hypothetical protein
MLYVLIESAEGKVLNSVAAFAPQSNKDLFVEVESGEGLVGQCFADKKLIHLQQIPENYMEITSGLGKKQPDALVLSPLLFNEEAYGVLELACFGKAEDHKISFIKKASEYLGYTFSYLEFTKGDFEKSPTKGDNAYL